MKILYVTNHMSIAKQSGGFINDYLNDLAFYGLHELFGEDVVDSTSIISMYCENQDRIAKQRIYGGFTSLWLIEKDLRDRKNIVEKINDRFYDLIIYGSIFRCQDYYDIVSKAYDRSKIILLDGSDETNIHPLHEKHPYFKRELIYSTLPNTKPISFAYPTNKFTKSLVTKSQMLATCLPGKKETYIFTNEKDYCQDYQRSYYGLTCKKDGWDCLRHYEILGNYCIPHFIDLENCPNSTMANMPKDLILEARHVYLNFNEDQYFSILNDIYEYSKNNLSTKALAEYIIGQV